MCLRQKCKKAPSCLPIPFVQKQAVTLGGVGIEKICVEVSHSIIYINSEMAFGGYYVYIYILWHFE